MFLKYIGLSKACNARESVLSIGVGNPENIADKQRFDQDEGKAMADRSGKGVAAVAVVVGVEGGPVVAAVERKAPVLAAAKLFPPLPLPLPRPVRSSRPG